jgi:antitoxin CcdA
MRQSANKTARRHPVNLTADSELVERVRGEKGNLSALLEQSMRAYLTQKELERWKEDNRLSFESYNKMIEEHGLFSEDMGLL